MHEQKGEHWAGEQKSATNYKSFAIFRCISTDFFSSFLSTLFPLCHISIIISVYNLVWLFLCGYYCCCGGGCSGGSDGIFSPELWAPINFYWMQQNVEWVSFIVTSLCQCWFSFLLFLVLSLILFGLWLRGCDWNNMCLMLQLMHEFAHKCTCVHIFLFLFLFINAICK